jgi:3-isopropylmalate dehydrogenase
MTTVTPLRIAVLAGDGIGREIMPPCLEILHRVADAVGGFSLHFEQLEAGAAFYREKGIALPDETLKRAEEADAILLGAMGLPDVRTPDGIEIAPQLDLRERFQLFAGLRPARRIPGVPTPLADPRARDINFMLVRESTEGLFAGRGTPRIEAGVSVSNSLTVTRGACERLFDLTFALARRRREAGRAGHVTCVDKANVLPAFAFFREIFDERAASFPDITTEHCYIDAMALNLVQRPWDYEVIVTENMFGDILSDLSAALIGGMGMAPSADCGTDRAVFQPCHGSAPDIMGTGKANPTAMILSAAMMLDWLGEKCGLDACRKASGRTAAAVDSAFADGTLRPFDLGGNDGTKAISDAILARI